MVLLFAGVWRAETPKSISAVVAKLADANFQTWRA